MIDASQQISAVARCIGNENTMHRNKYSYLSLITTTVVAQSCVQDLASFPEQMSHKASLHMAMLSDQRLKPGASIQGVVR